MIKNDTHIAVLAGEKSGDLLGAPLMHALRERLPGVRFSGVGGEHMQAAGLDSLIDMRRLSLMGLVEVLRHLPDLLAAKKTLLDHWQNDTPQIFIGIDAPDFNLRIAKALHARGVHTVQYVSPSLWAWKEKRIHTIQAAIDQVLCLFPFETAVYDKHGVPATCVGHPLRDRLRAQSVQTARQALALPDMAAPLLGIFPGSREGEVRRLFPVYAQAFARLRERLPGLQALVSVADEALAPWLESERTDGMTLMRADSATMMSACDALLLTSGTITLEATLLARPMVVGYRVNALTAAIARRLLKINRFSLPNLLAGEDIVRECIQEDCTPQTLADALYPLLAEEKARAAQQRALAEVAALLPENVSARAAEAVIAEYQR
ncbi:MAG: lipid-A-disaccharide synthase [Cardiobacteriaceae bacterium]|nr:lipid-A-disaccharide synthase [Cardiobacteriaceae bacterium]